LLGLALCGTASYARAETESARKIPIAYSVDVVVVGGSTHAVAAAAAAARNGAKVFLAAPRPYLGEDLCATLRLGLEPGSKPASELGRRIFAARDGSVLQGGTPFTYETNVPSAAKHRDTQPPSVLADGRGTSASTESVQFDADVTITADLGDVRTLRRVRLVTFEKPSDYGVAAVQVTAGGVRIDAEDDTPRRTVENSGRPWSRVVIDVSVSGRARQVEILVTRPADCGRLLLGELTIETDAPADAAAESPRPGRLTTTPYRVKSVLDRELLDAGVQFLHGCYATDTLVDQEGRPAGIIMANRAGRQAVVAKVIIDATDRAIVARLTGADARPWPDEPVEFERVVLLKGTAGKTRAVHHRLRLAMPDGSYRSFARAEQDARDQTYQDGQLRASESLFFVPSDPIVTLRVAGTTKSAFAPRKHVRSRSERRAAGVSPLIDPEANALGSPNSSHSRSERRLSDEGAVRQAAICEANLGPFRLAAGSRVYVLSGCADLPRNEAAELLLPLGLVEMGRRIGARAAEEALGLPAPSRVRVHARDLTSRKATPSGAGDVCEMLGGVRPTDRDLKTVPSPPRDLPVLGRSDVVVIGGGTAGAAAAIGAARRGAKTLVVEYLEGLGGLGTLGLIGKAYHGRDAGFAAEVPFPDKQHNVEHKMEWYRRELRKADAEIWLGAIGCGAWVEDGRVKGAVVATPQGRGLVLANTIIDATGAADVAIAAGADYLYGADAVDIALQGTGLPTRPLDRYYVNSDYMLVDESDMLDTWRALVGARAAMQQGTFDSGTLIQTRERRRVVGDHVLRYLDQVAGRTYPDSIVLSASDYDSHGYPSQVYFALLPHDKKSRKANHPAPGGTCYTPYRCLLPKGLDGILVVGVGISMERDASAMVRMQLDISNQGYAAGVAAAMAAANDSTVRSIDVRKLQRHLVETGALPEEVLSHGDSFPLPESAVREGVTSLAAASNPKEAARPLAIVLSHQQAALPMLRAAYASASAETKLTYAKILGVLGDADVVPCLAKALDPAAWDDKILQGGAAEYAHLPTPVDALIVALGSTRDERGLPPILRKLDTLDAETTLSHHRAVAIALERIASPAAAEPLARLLEKPGMRGHAMTALEPQHNANREKRRRTGPLREIVLARALYRCDDHQGLGEQILREYAADVRGLFARHARAVLDASPDGNGRR